MNINDGGPAYPVAPSWNQNGDMVEGGFDGMSLRDWFAGHENIAELDDQNAIPSESMCVALAGRDKPNHGWSCKSPEQWVAMLQWDSDWRAALKYIRADAMLKARDSRSCHGPTPTS